MEQTARIRKGRILSLAEESKHLSLSHKIHFDEMGDDLWNFLQRLKSFVMSIIEESEK